jgi:tetratricopeptide (TPR) repeat protein
MGACEIVAWLWLIFAAPAAASFTVNGTIQPPGIAAVWLYGANASFAASTLTRADGRFHFGGIQPGTYMLTVVATAHGEWRQTIDVGPSVADAKGRMNVAVHIDEAKTLADRVNVVSARELSIPQAARREYARAEQRLSKHDVNGAAAHLQRATVIAPQFAAAWNTLGIIAYHAQGFARAEHCFRKALAADPDQYAPLVNLGGVLLNLGQFQGAWSFNMLAVSKQPNDPLAHAQLGMACAALNKLDTAEAELREAIRLDPRHFTDPQLVLADVYVRQRKPEAAADLLEQFLLLHPDFRQAHEIRQRIATLEAGR